MKKKLLPAVILMLGLLPTKGQQPDSLRLEGLEWINRQLEDLEEAADNDADFTDLTMDLDDFLERPLNLNVAGKEDLRKLNTLTGNQMRNLIDYRTKYGMFYSIYELQAIEGFNREVLERIMPFVCLEEPGEAAFEKQRFTRGRHQLILRFQRKLIKPQGYTLPPDSMQAEKGSAFYTGDPNRYYLRYRYMARDKLSIGLTAEKDPGEAFPAIPRKINDELREQLKGKLKGFDFYSFHLGLEKLGPVRSVVVGDYHLRFGQGLVLWSGLSFGSSGDPATIKRYAPGLSFNSSSNEALFMRGMAVNSVWKQWSLYLFYSRRKTDASVNNENGRMVVSSLKTDGYHRTPNELLNKNSLLQEHYGGHLTYESTRFRLGITAFKTLLGLDYEREEKPANIFLFRGRENINAGADFDFLLRRASIYGEFGYSINGGWALLTGLMHQSDKGGIFNLLFREYRPAYQNLLARAYGRRDGNANERGVSIAMQLPLSGSLTLTATTDQYIYPWITTRNINPYRGSESGLQLRQHRRDGPELLFRYRFREGDLKDNTDLTRVDEVQKEQKHQFRMMARYQASPSFSFKSQAEYCLYKSQQMNAMEEGALLLQDVYYHPEGWPFRLTFRYAMFNTDSYASRIYAYENDVLYASSMPAFSGKGFRYYLLLKAGLARWLDAWIRFGMTVYTDRQVTGSGTEEIPGNKVPEIKLQLLIKP
jgi:hypothetical protein